MWLVVRVFITLAFAPSVASLLFALVVSCFTAALSALGAFIGWWRAAPEIAARKARVNAELERRREAAELQEQHRLRVRDAAAVARPRTRRAAALAVAQTAAAKREAVRRNLRAGLSQFASEAGINVTEVSRLQPTHSGDERM